MPRLLEWATLNTACCPWTPWPKATTVHWASNGRSVRAVSVQSQRDELYCQVYISLWILSSNSCHLSTNINILASVFQKLVSIICPLQLFFCHQVSFKLSLVFCDRLSNMSFAIYSPSTVIFHLSSSTCLQPTTLTFFLSKCHPTTVFHHLWSDSYISPPVLNHLSFAFCHLSSFICLSTLVLCHLSSKTCTSPSFLTQVFLAIWSPALVFLCIH